MSKQVLLDRRGFLRGGASVAMAAVLGSSETLAAEAGEKPKIRPLEGKMDYESIRKRAREMMMPRCYVCPECNGRGPCVGQVPGFGGMGASRGFQANYDSLAAVQLNSRVIHGVHVPDTSIDFFGTKISMPAVAAPTGGTTYNMGGKLTEKEFVTAICGGCTKAGTLGAVADGIGDPLPVFEERLQTLKSLGYKAIVGLKPRLNKDIIERMKLAEQAGVVALTIDLDSAGRAARATKGQTVEPKTFEQLKELVSASPLPLLFKGIMTPDEAELCVQAGAAGIVVSNHGSRAPAHRRQGQRSLLHHGGRHGCPRYRRREVSGARRPVHARRPSLRPCCSWRSRRRRCALCQQDQERTRGRDGSHRRTAHLRHQSQDDRHSA